MLRVSDAVIVTASVAVAQVVRFGSDDALTPNGGSQFPALVVSLCLIGAWLLALQAFHTLDRRMLGSGPQEYSRVITACLSVFGLWAMVDLLFKLDVARGFLMLALPIGTVALVLSRWLWRKRLIRQRIASKNLERVLVVGGRNSAAPVISRLAANPELGYAVTGVCLPFLARDAGPTMPVDGHDIPILGTFDDIVDAVCRSGATTVAITSAETLGHKAMQDLSWELEATDVDMLVAPGVNDVAGPRMTMRPAAGLPLLHIDKPQYEGAIRLRKWVLDRLGAAVIAVCAAPVLLAVAIAIKLDSRGPVFYRGTRVGLNNKHFRMWKFRTMVDDADAQKAALRHLDQGAGVMFKMREDPRITRVGKILRHYSIDEVPQVINVLRGHMSLVGPRPPLPDEVEKYDGRVSRRMLVKPGMTGLWQVSGRSDLTWEESVRLDLSYVENWSLFGDLIILWRTIRVVATKNGAY